MSASDYTNLRRYRTQITCNTLPQCHTNNTTTTSNAVTLSNSGYCNVPTQCVSSTGQIVSADLIYCPDTAFTNQKYVTKTVSASFVVPVKDATVGFLVEKRLPFVKNQRISCRIEDNENNYFNGSVLDYDADTGFLSIGQIDNITGDFSNTVVYKINLILFDPETMRLKERMDYLYKYLFQVSLNTTPNYNPVFEQLVYFERRTIDIMYYLFDFDIRIVSGYVFSEEYLFNIMKDTLYPTLFDVDILQVLNFQPNGNPDVLLTNLKNALYEIYIYLFDVNLEQNIWFNPNSLI
jgi:hypothetical protein